MDLIQIVVVLIIIGVILWMINTYLPMAPPIKMIINVVVVLIICLWLLRVFGIGTYVVAPHRP